MNTLTLIKKQIEKQAALHDAQISHTAYRGVKYDNHSVESKQTHGTFCYRGRTYVKRDGRTTTNWDRIPRFCSIPNSSLR